MGRPRHDSLSRRERQIVEIVYRLREATVADVRRELPDPPSYSAVRALLRILEEKGHLRHREDGPRYVYAPRVPREKAARPALKGVLETFFDGSREKLVAALLDEGAAKLSPEELDNLQGLITRARKAGR
jgi:predicted transcriptional regulator